MSDQDVNTPDSGEADQQILDVTPEDMISRGKGVKLEAIEDGTPAAAAIEAFKDLVTRHKDAEALAEALKVERNQTIYVLKSEHNVSFSALAEIIGATSSLVLYLYERAQGKTAKQIREESQRSSAAKRQFRESDPDKKAGRKQTPEEKAFRKQQRDALKEFLATQQAADGDAEGDLDDDDDDD